MHATSLVFLSFDPHNDFSQWTQFIRLIMQFLHSPVTYPPSVLTDIHNKRANIVLPVVTWSLHPHTLESSKLWLCYRPDSGGNAVRFPLFPTVRTSSKAPQNTLYKEHITLWDRSEQIYSCWKSSFVTHKIWGRVGPQGQSGRLAPIMNQTLDIQLHSLVTILTALLRLHWLMGVRAE